MPKNLIARKKRKKTGRRETEKKASLIVSRKTSREIEEKKGDLIVSRYHMGQVGKATKRFCLRLRRRQEGGRRGNREVLGEWGWVTEKRPKVRKQREEEGERAVNNWRGRRGAKGRRETSEGRREAG